MSADRVLLVAGPATGGVAGHVAGLAAGLDQLGWDVGVFTSPITATRFSGTKLDVVPEWPVGRHNLSASLKTLRRLIGEASVVHAHGHQPVCSRCSRRRR